jgi:hypothetical protein
MHIKNFDGFEIRFHGPDLHRVEIDSLMSFLHKQIEEIDSYSDKSLFFQNPKIFEGWLDLVRTIKKIETWEATEDKTKWEDRTETYVAYILTLREYFLKYQTLYCTYFGQIRKIINEYGDTQDEYFISSDAKEILLAEKDLLDLDDVTQFLTDLNSSSLDTRYSVFKTLSKVFDFLSALLDNGLIILMELNPSIDDFAKAIDDDLREWTFSFGESILKGMKEDLNRHFKEYRTAPYTPELWGQLLDADEDALKMAKCQELATCDDVKQEHWGEDMKTQMDENSNLMQLIYSSCRTDELFDMRKVVDIQRFISLLTPDNLDMFYDIIVRRSLIQCEMFPELKKQHEEWLNNDNEQQPEQNNETGMDAARQSKLDDIIGILKRGDWKQPATADNIEQLLNIVFGKDTSLLEEGDADKCEKMWALVEGGGGDRIVIVPANLAGFFSDENLLTGSPKEISNDLFGKHNNQSNNINKGKSNYRSNAFEEIIPFLKKYIEKIIRHV